MKAIIIKHNTVIISWKTNTYSFLLPLKKIRRVTRGIAGGIVILFIGLASIAAMREGVHYYNKMKSNYQNFQDRKEGTKELHEHIKKLAQLYDIDTCDSSIVDKADNDAELNAVLRYEDYMARRIRKEIFYRELVNSHFPTVNPVPNGVLASGFGYRIDPITKATAFHRGLDIVHPRGHSSYIIAPADGVIKRTGSYGDYGSVIIIDHKIGYETRYGHCNEIYCEVGDFVHRGDIIGTTGMTGRAVGVHLHYEVRYTVDRENRPDNPKRYVSDDYAN